MDLSSYSSATLTFYIVNTGGSDVIDIYGAQSGNTYTKINTTSYGVNSSWTQITLNLPSSLVGAGNTAVKLRFQGTSDGGGSNIGLDNVVVSGTQQSSITWSPVTNLYTNPAATTAYTTGSNLSTVYSKPSTNTTYTATATLGTCTSSGTSTITINPTATIALTSSGSTTSQTVCSGSATPIANITYSIGNGGTGATIAWSPSTPSSTLTGSYNNGVFTISGYATVLTATTYTYTVTTSGGCGQATATGSITVNAAPVINNASVTICSGTQFPWSATGTNIPAGTTYTWSAPSISPASSVTGFNPNGGINQIAVSDNPLSNNTLNPGTATYTVTPTSSGCPGNTFTVAVTVAATLNNSLVSAVSPICSGQNSLVTFSGAATNGATTSSSLSYTVDGGSTKTINLNSSGNNTLNTPNLTANSTYTLTGATSTTNGHTCSASFNQSSTVVVHQLPTVAAITPTEGNGKAYVQVNNNLQLSDATTGGSWSTSNGSLASIDGSGKVTGNAAGAPTISYTTAQDGNGCQNTATATVQVYNPDYVNITASNNFTNNANWQINRGDGTYTTTGVTAPSASNTGYTSITVQQPLNMDVDFQLPSGKSFNITGSGTMAILPNITFSSNGTVAFNGNAVTVKSDATGTGAIGVMATAIGGASNVTTERYLPQTTTNTSGSRTGRAWRLITAPVTGQTIGQAWQEGLVANTNSPAVGNTTYGTLITGQAQGNSTNAFSHGFDFWDVIAVNTTASIRTMMQRRQVAATGLRLQPSAAHW